MTLTRSQEQLLVAMAIAQLHAIQIGANAERDIARLKEAIRRIDPNALPEGQ